MLTRKTVNLTGLIGLAIMVLLFILVFFRLVPQSMFLPLGLTALALFMIRITMRLILSRQERLEKDAKESGTAGEEKPEQRGR